MQITTEVVLNQYTPIKEAERIKAEKTPYIDFILQHTGCDRISVCQLGEELMGADKYHEKHRYYNGQEANFRTYEAREVTGVLTQALRKLCKMGVLTRHEEKDKSHLIEIECEDWAYFDANGHQLPDKIDVITVDGITVQIGAQYLPGVQARFGMCKKKVYPKLVYYTFTK